MLTLPRYLVTVAASVAVGASALVVPSAAATMPRADSGTALRVSYLEDSLGNNRLQILAPEGAVLGAGDVVVTTFPYSRWERFAVYVDPESAPAAGAVTLEAGSQCSATWPFTSPAPLTAGTIYCSYANSDSLDVEFDLQGSKYAGGELAMINTTSVSASLRGSPFTDQFYGGSGADSVDGAGGDDIIFGGGGDDWLLGGDGADTIDGEGGRDVIYGDAGADSITVDEDGKAPDWVNCNNFDRAVQNTDNDPDNPPINRVFADAGIDRVTDCGIAGAPAVKTYPAIPDTPAAGQPLWAKAGTWEGKALILSYAWFACPTADADVPFDEAAPAGDCVEVAAKDGEKGLTYTPRSTDVGKFLVLRATARNNSGFAVAVSKASEAVKPASATPGPVRDLSAKASVARENGRRTLSIEVTWAAPLDVGPGVKEYLIEFKGVTTPVVLTSKKTYTLKLAPFPKRAWIDIVVSAQGPKGSSQRGSASRTAVRTPAR